jgi:hypothetical protein
MNDHKLNTIDEFINKPRVANDIFERKKNERQIAFNLRNKFDKLDFHETKPFYSAAKEQLDKRVCFFYS